MQGNDGELLSMDDTILKWLDIHATEFEPTNTSCFMGNYVINALSADLGFGEYLKRLK